MKTFASILNILLLLGFLVSVTASGFPKETGWALFSLVVLLTPLVNLFCLHMPSSSDWLILYFKRKALEEQKKIEALNRKP